MLNFFKPKTRFCCFACNKIYYTSKFECCDLSYQYLEQKYYDKKLRMLDLTTYIFYLDNIYNIKNNLCLTIDYNTIGEEAFCKFSKNKPIDFFYIENILYKETFDILTAKEFYNLFLKLNENIEFL